MLPVELQRKPHESGRMVNPRRKNPTPSVCEPDTIVADKRSRGLEACLSGVAQKPAQARRTPACVIWAHARSSEPSVFIPRQPDSTTVTS